MKIYSSLTVLLLALAFLSLPCFPVSSSPVPNTVLAPLPSDRQAIAGKLVTATATFAINSILDSPDVLPGDGICSDSSGNCTLRAAIMEANALGGTDTINFDISPSGPKTISPTSLLPVINGTVIINGTTQPGFSGMPIIEVKGSSIGGAVILSVAGSNCTIRGLVVNSVDGVGINVMGSNNKIIGNFIGTDLSGTVAQGCADAGIVILTSGNTVGGTAPGEANLIAFNGDGVSVRDGSSNLIIANSIINNGMLGIDLNNDGVTGNDSCDADTGPNGLQNYPTLTAAQSNPGTVVIQGTFNGAASSTYQLHFYSSPTCDGSNFGEGQSFIGSTMVTTDASCNAMFGASFPVPVPAGQVITATATDPFANTSEFSQCVTVTAASCLVTCPSSLTKNTDANQCGAVVTYPPPTTSGVCDTVTCNPASGSFFPIGTTNVNCLTGSMPACSFGITVVDNAPPRIICSDNVIAPTDPGSTVAVVNYAFAMVSDNCPGTSAVCLPPSGTVFPLGVSTVTCSAKDLAGNTAACSFTVSVTDTQAPLIICPANVTIVPSSGQTSAVVNYPPPTVTDNLPGATVVCSPLSGSSFPPGTTTVTCTATDARGNKASCSFIVNVGGPLAKVTVTGNKAAIEFAAVPPARKPPKAKKSPCSLFTVENIGFGPLVLTLDSISRTGTDVDNRRITDPNDTRFFSISRLNSDQSLTPLDIGGVLTLQPGQAQILCVKFAALLPAPAGKTTGLSASDVLPDTVTSKITFRQNAGANIAVPLIARVSTGVVLINPLNPRTPPTVTFARSGNDITVSYSVFDSNLDVSRAKYEFTDANGQVVAGPFEVDLAESIRAINLVRGQSFTVEQRFTGASGSSAITGVRVTVFDGETSTVGDSSTASTKEISASSIKLLKKARGVALILPDVKLTPQLQ